MRNPTRKLSVLLSLLALTACSGPQATPTPTVASTVSPIQNVTPLKISFANTTEQLRDALPTAYGKEQFDRRTNKEAFGWSPRDDPFEGRKVDPESCREILRTGGRKVDTFAEFPYLPYAVADPKTNAFPVQVELTSLPTPYSDKYMDLIVQPADIRLSGPTFNEPQLLAFAKTLEATATRKLH